MRSRALAAGFGAAVAAAAVLAGPGAAARTFPLAIDAQDEDDLRELYEAGRISEDDLASLLELLENPVDVNFSERDDLYSLPGLTLEMAEAILKDRVANGPFSSLADLARVPGITAEAIREIVPFAYARKPETRTDPVRARLKVRVAKNFWEGEPVEGASPESTLSVADLGLGQAPRTYLLGDVHAYRWLRAGALFFMQEGLGGVVYDPESRDLHASWGKPVVEFSKAFLSATRAEGSAVVGSFTAGYGLGLTFDVSDRIHPHGWYSDLTFYESSPDSAPGAYKSRARLFGGAARLTALRFGRESLDLSVFGSSWLHDVYQYDIAVTGGEDVDPLRDETVSPRIYIDGQRVGWLTLPNAYRESVVGGNVTFRSGRRNHVGVTAWVGHLDFDVIEGVEDPREFLLREGYPTEELYGAFGVNGAFGIGVVDLRGEYARTFTGGNALLFKAVASPLWGEIEGSLRRYETGFDNPHARGIAAPDAYGGMRDRDEQGARLKVRLDPLKGLSVRATIDLWQRISLGISNAEAYFRVSARPVPALEIAAFADLKNRDLVNNGRTRIYGSDDEDYLDLDEEGQASGNERLDSVPDADVTYGAGEKHSIGGEVRLSPIPKATFEVLYRRTYEDSGKVYPTGDGPCEPWFQIGHYMAFRARLAPTKTTTVSMRARYRDDDVHGGIEERSVEAWLQGDQLIAGKVKVSLRGTFGRFLPDPDAPWKDACETAGIPTLQGSCAVPAADEEEVYVTEGRNYGEIAASVEVRF